jgi:hypothetical protein
MKEPRASLVLGGTEYRLTSAELHALAVRVANALNSLRFARVEATRERHGGLAAIAGKWPGDESDEQVAAAVKALGIEGCADGPCPPGRCLYQEGVDLRRRRPEVFQDHDEEVRRSYREADKRVRGDTTRERLRRLIEARKPDPDCPSCRGSGRQPYYDGLPCDVCGGDIREGEEQ